MEGRHFKILKHKYEGYLFIVKNRSIEYDAPIFAMFTENGMRVGHEAAGDYSLLNPSSLLPKLFIEHIKEKYDAYIDDANFVPYNDSVIIDNKDELETQFFSYEELDSLTDNYEFENAVYNHGDYITFFNGSNHVSYLIGDEINAIYDFVESEELDDVLEQFAEAYTKNSLDDVKEIGDFVISIPNSNHFYIAELIRK